MDKYIAEREQKRLSGLDIPKHCRYFDSEDLLTYAGVRNVDGQMLTLLKHENTIMVLPIDQPTTRRLKKLTIGDAVTVTRGKIKTKGRSR